MSLEQLWGLDRLLSEKAPLCDTYSFNIHAWMPVFHDDALSLTVWQCVPRLRRAVTVEDDWAVFLRLCKS